MALSCIISEINDNHYIGRISQFFHTPLHSTLPLGGPSQNVAMPFATEQIERCGYLKNNLVKYSLSWSIARSLCNNLASAGLESKQLIVWRTDRRTNVLRQHRAVKTKRRTRATDIAISCTTFSSSRSTPRCRHTYIDNYNSTLQCKQ